VSEQEEDDAVDAGEHAEREHEPEADVFLGGSAHAKRVPGLGTAIGRMVDARFSLSRSLHPRRTMPPDATDRLLAQG
jgi:hypothetical protein